MIWCTIDKAGSLSLVFLSNLILARILVPEDFGCIAMLNVFLAVADVIVHGGFGMALIQKKDASQVDYSSAFFCNLIVAILLFFIFYFTAPFIAQFYRIPLLKDVLRVQSSALIIASFSVVQLSILKKELRFNDLAKRNILSGLVGFVVGVVFAICGMGVWSLVASSLTSAISGILLLWRVSNWRPSLIFSWISLKSLFQFGGMLMFASILTTIYDNIQSLIVGKFFSASDLGYVNQAKKLESVPSGAMSSVVTQVSFPVFSQLQDDNEKLRNGMRKSVIAIEYVNMPLMVLLIVIAEPLIIFLYGERWIMSIPFFQILCVARLISVVVPLNMSVIGAQGNGKLYLWTEFLKCSLSLLLVAYSVRYGIYALLWTLAIIPYMQFVVCSMVNKKKFNYGLWDQFKDVFPILLVTGVVALFVGWLGTFLYCHQFIVMLVQVVVFLGLYVGITRILKYRGFKIYADILKTRFNCRKWGV